MPTKRFSDPRFDWLAQRLDQLDASHMRRRLIPRQVCGKWIGQAGQRLLNFGSNDYLGIAMQSSQSVADGIPLANKLHPTNSPPTLIPPTSSGATASPLVCGFSPLHQRLCDEISKLEQTEATILFPTGFAACSSVAATLAEAGDLILSDSLNHASLIDGCRLSKAERFIYPHRDHAAVDCLLKTHRHRFTRAFILTDSIFSMDGTRAPLDALCDVAERHDAILIVDEAHATGVLGRRGSGMCEEMGVEHRVPIRIGTLSKAIGSHGGFVTGPQTVIDYLTQRARGLIYSTAAPPVIIDAALRGLHIIKTEPDRRAKVLALTNQMIQRIGDLRLKTVSDQTPIVPVILRDPAITLDASQRLHEAGFFVPAIRPPTVPEKGSRLRISLSAAHDEADIEALSDALQATTRT